MLRFAFRPAFRIGAGLAGILLCVVAHAQYDTNTPTVPSPDYHQRGLSMIPDAPFSTSFFDVFFDLDSPITGPRGDQLPAPGMAFDSFFDITYRIDFYQAGTTNFLGTSMGSGTSTIRRRNISPNGNLPQTFDTEMLSMSLSGVGPPGVFLVRESPSLPSRGMTVISQGGGGGQFHIDSFFDVFTELSLDGGQTWRPMIGQNPDGSQHLTPSPEPASMAVLGVGLFAMMRKHRRAKK